MTLFSSVSLWPPRLCLALLQKVSISLSLSLRSSSSSSHDTKDEDSLIKTDLLDSCQYNRERRLLPLFRTRLGKSIRHTDRYTDTEYHQIARQTIWCQTRPENQKKKKSKFHHRNQEDEQWFFCDSYSKKGVKSIEKEKKKSYWGMYSVFLQIPFQQRTFCSLLVPLLYNFSALHHTYRIIITTSDTLIFFFFLCCGHTSKQRHTQPHRN